MYGNQRSDKTTSRLCEAKPNAEAVDGYAHRQSTTQTQGETTRGTGSSREHRQGATSSLLQRRRVRVQSPVEVDDRMEIGEWNLRSTTRLRLERRKRTMRTRSQRTNTNSESIHDNETVTRSPGETEQPLSTRSSLWRQDPGQRE